MAIKAITKIALVGMFSFGLTLFPLAVNGDETSGIAGGPNFPNNAEFPFISGIESSVQSSFFIQNLGSQPMELDISHGAPTGILIQPSLEQETIFEPGEAGDFFFDITVTEPVVPGTYRTTINVKEKSSGSPDGGGTVYVPAVSGELIIEVVGASAAAKLSAVSALTRAPATGDLELIYVSTRGVEVPIIEARGSVIESQLVPGDYIFSFNVAGLQEQNFEFSIAENEDLDLVFEIPTLEFLGVGAVPTRDDRDYIQSVELTMDIFNNLEQIDEQIFFEANISRNGELVDEFVIAALPNLPQEGSILRANYIRESGFEQGDWQFEFEIVGETFSLTSNQVVEINSPGIFQSYLQEIIIAIGALVIIGLLLPKSWWNKILRRSVRTTKKAREQSSELTPSPVEPEIPSLAGSAQTVADSSHNTKQDADTSNLPKTDVRPETPAKRLIQKGKTQVDPPANESKKEVKPKRKEKTVSLSGSRLFDFSEKKGSEHPSKPRKQKKSESDQMLTSTGGGLEKVLSIRRRLLELEDKGIRSLALNYKIDSIFVDEGEVVIQRSTGKPYTSSQIREIGEFRGLESELDAVETPVLRAEAIKILVREKLEASRV